MTHDEDQGSPAPDQESWTERWPIRRTFIGYASVYGPPVDAYGDIVEPGAFAKSLADWAAKGDPIPLLWGYDTKNPFSNVGHIAEAIEDDRGLRVKGVFDLENETAAQVYRLVEGRRTTAMSFAFGIIDQERQKGVNLLKQLDLHEVSIVPVGANSRAGVHSVKAARPRLLAARVALENLRQEGIS